MCRTHNSVSCLLCEYFFLWTDKPSFLLLLPLIWATWLILTTCSDIDCEARFCVLLVQFRVCWSNAVDKFWRETTSFGMLSEKSSPGQDLTLRKQSCQKYSILRSLQAWPPCTCKFLFYLPLAARSWGGSGSLPSWDVCLPVTLACIIILLELGLLLFEWLLNFWGWDNVEDCQIFRIFFRISDF